MLFIGFYWQNCHRVKQISLFELQFNEEILRETHCTITSKSTTPL